MKRKIEITTNKPLSTNHIYGRGRNGHTYKKPEAKDWQTTLAWYVKEKRMKFAKCRVDVDFYFEDDAKIDLDNLLKLISDALVDGGLIADDRWQILNEWRPKGHLDRVNPRTEITIHEL